MLCHKDVNLPSVIKAYPDTYFYNLNVSHHAHCQAKCKNIILPCDIKFSGSNIFEAEIIGGQVVKLGLRLPYNDRQDLCIILRMNKHNQVTIITCYLNSKNDNHPTLNKSNYNGQ